MRRILVTGMSGTGKSTVVAELAARRFAAVDLDCDEYSEWVAVAGPNAFGAPVEADRDWVWREDRVDELLSREVADVLFVSGCAANMGKFLPRFDSVILLSAPVNVILQRMASRSNNQYGKSPEEAARVMSLVESVEPALRRIAGHEVDTRSSIEEVVLTVLALTGTR